MTITAFVVTNADATPCTGVAVIGKSLVVLEERDRRLRSDLS